MSTFYVPQPEPPRRTPMACSMCRAAKLKCVTAEHPPRNPCLRCTQNNLVCEYLPITTRRRDRARHDNSDGAETSSPTPYSAGSTSMPGPAPYAHPNPRGQPPAMPGAAPPLPYTGPPPVNTRPRYSNGNSYPDLSLSGGGSQHARGHYTPHGAYNAQAAAAGGYPYAPPGGGHGSYVAPPTGYPPPGYGGSYGAGSGTASGFPPHISGGQGGGQQGPGYGPGPGWS